MDLMIQDAGRQAGQGITILCLTGTLCIVATTPVVVQERTRENGWLIFAAHTHRARYQTDKTRPSLDPNLSQATAATLVILHHSFKKLSAAGGLDI